MILIHEATERCRGETAVTDPLQHASSLVRIHLAGEIGARLADSADNPTLRSSYHEASHVSVGRLYGRRATRVEVYPGGLGGITHFDDGPPTECALQDDMRKVLNILKIFDQAPELNLEKLCLETEALVRKDWANIERIARCLHNRTIGGEIGVVTGGEIEMLCNRS